MPMHRGDYEIDYDPENGSSNYDSDDSYGGGYEAADALVGLRGDSINVSSSDLSTDEAYEQAFQCAERLFRRACNELDTINIRRFSTLADAKVYIANIRGGGESLRLFATHKPRRQLHHNGVVTYTRMYTVGTLGRYFRWCHSLDFSVYLEECIPSETPSYLHFDMEIKQVEDSICLPVPPLTAAPDTPAGLAAVLQGHLELIRLDLSNGRLREIARIYEEHSRNPLTEDECKEGITWTVALLRAFLDEHLGVPDANFSVLSGCRASKLSFHIVCKDLLVESTSIALLVFEIGKHFAVKVLEELRDMDLLTESFALDGLFQSSFLVRFLLRALMLEKTVQTFDLFDEMGRGGTTFGFSGSNDTPIDEAIYTPDHLLRLAGACKPGGSALHPIPLDLTGTMMKDEKRFSVLFKIDDAHAFNKWCDHLVTSPRRLLDSPRDEALLCGMSMTSSFPFPVRWHSRRHQTSSRSATQYRTLAYKGARFVEVRKTLVQARRLLMDSLPANGANAPSMTENGRVDSDDLFVGEDGVEKAFRCFVAGDVLFHVHNGIMERTASARVFSNCGGFRCFGCGQSYFLIDPSPPWESKFEFYEDERVRSADPSAYIGSALDEANWKKLMEKKFVVISAPMGSGKTEALGVVTDIVYQRRHQANSGMHAGEENLDGPDSAVVLSHRRVLAQASATRLSMVCYKDLSTRELEIAAPELLTIVVNSLPRVNNGMTYGVLILDEAGLIRRHLFSGTIRGRLLSIFYRLREMIRGASNVILLQDGITQADIQFYTELDNVDSSDRRHVSAFSFEKPIELHPITVLSNLHVALVTLLGNYTASLVEGKCVKPIMVFCSSAVLAEFLLGELRAIAEGQGVNPERVQGIWSSVKETEFNRMFCTDPNAAAVADAVDVVVCTSVIGAGFSIDVHFFAYFAFLMTGILAFPEEQQFVQRLRFNARGLPVGACRRSYIFVQEGRGDGFDYESVRSNYGAVRGVLGRENRGLPGLNEVEEIGVLAEAQARVETERAATMACHDKLWADYGASLQSPFVRVYHSEADVKDAEKIVKPKIKAWGVTKKGYIEQLLVRSGQRNDETRDDEGHPDMVIPLGMSPFMEVAVEALQTELDLYYAQFAPVLQHLVRASQIKRVYDTMILTSNGRTRHAASLNKFVRCLLGAFDRTYVLKESNNEHTRAYDSASLKKIAHLILFTSLSHDMFGATPVERAFLSTPGPFPFYAGAAFVVSEDLCKYIRSVFEDDTAGDTNEVLANKELLRKCALCVLGMHSKPADTLLELYTKPERARVLIKRLVTGCGLTLTRSRQSTKDRRWEHTIQLIPSTIASALCLCRRRRQGECNRERLVALLPLLVHSNNLSEICREAFKEGIELFKSACVEKGIDPDLPQGIDPNLPQARGTLPYYPLHPHSASDREYERQNAILPAALPTGLLDSNSDDDREDYNEAEARDLRVARMEADEHDDELESAELERARAAAIRLPASPPDASRANQRNHQRLQRNKYIDDEAGVSGDDDDGYDEDEDGSDDSTSSVQSTNTTPHESTRDSDDSDDSVVIVLPPLHTSERPDGESARDSDDSDDSDDSVVIVLPPLHTSERPDGESARDSDDSDDSDDSVVSVLPPLHTSKRQGNHVVNESAPSVRPQPDDLAEYLMQLVDSVECKRRKAKGYTLYREYLKWKARVSAWSDVHVRLQSSAEERRDTTRSSCLRKCTVAIFAEVKAGEPSISDQLEKAMKDFELLQDAPGTFANHTTATLIRHYRKCVSILTSLKLRQRITSGNPMEDILHRLFRYCTEISRDYIKNLEACRPTTNAAQYVAPETTNRLHEIAGPKLRCLFYRMEMMSANANKITRELAHSSRIFHVEPVCMHVLRCAYWLKERPSPFGINFFEVTSAKVSNAFDGFDDFDYSDSGECSQTKGKKRSRDDLCL